MNKINRFLFIISLVAIFFPAPIFAMEMDETESLYIKTVNGEIHEIQADAQTINKILQYTIFINASGTGEYDDPKVLKNVERLEDFQCNLLKQTEFIYIQTFECDKKTITLLFQLTKTNTYTIFSLLNCLVYNGYKKLIENTEHKIPVVSPIMRMSEFLKTNFTSKFNKRGIVKNNPLVLKQIDREELNLVIESINNIETLSQYLAGKGINEINNLLSAASFLQIKNIMPDIVLRLSSFIQSPNVFDKWIEAGGDEYLEKFNIHGGKISKELFDTALKLYIENSNIKIQKNIDPIILETYFSRVFSVDVFPNGKMIVSVVCNSYKIKIWNIKSRKLAKELQTKKNICLVKSSPNGQMLALGFIDGEINIWYIKTNKSIVMRKSCTGKRATLVAFTPNNKKIISVFRDCDNSYKIKIWNIKTCEEIAVFENCCTGISSIDFSPNPKKEILAVGLKMQGIIDIWDLKTITLIKTLKNDHKDNYYMIINPIKFSPNGKKLAVAGRALEISIWDLKTNQSITLEGHENGDILSVAFSPDGKKLASVDINRTIKIWDLKSKTLITTLTDKDGITRSIAFSLNGKTLVTGLSAGIKLWELYNEEEIEKLKNKTSTVCLLLLQSLLHAKNEDPIIDLFKFPKLQEIFESLQPYEQEIVEYILANIARDD